VVARHAEPNAWDPQAWRAAALLRLLDEFRLFPAAISRALVADALARSGISHSDQVLSRYPVLKITTQPPGKGSGKPWSCRGLRRRSHRNSRKSSNETR